jgi:two-component sensor histidine kinase
VSAGLSDSPACHPDLLDRLAAAVLQIKPLSISALVVACIALLIAIGLQTLIVLTAGVGIPFAGFFPAIALVTIIAGGPAGFAVGALSLFLLYWAVWEPHFTFHDLDSVQRYQLAWLAGCAILLIGLGLLCRSLLQRAYDRQNSMNVLIREMEHRRANTFSVLRAITTRTLSGHPEAAERLLRRFEAIRRTNDLLIRQPAGADISTILTNEMEGLNGDQVITAGDDVMLPASETRNLILIVHELFTNAVKYGALSVPSGRLRISWRREQDFLTILWEESGGPTVSAPVRNGFGTTLIEHCLAALQGKWDPVYEVSGFRCKLAIRTVEKGQTASS